MTIVEFLLERLRERERIALRCTAAWPSEAEKVYDGIYSVALPDGIHDRDEPVEDDWDVRIRREEAEFIVTESPASVVAEIAAHRAIIGWHSQNPHECEGPLGCEYVADDNSKPCSTMCALASVHADHPDYREEWKP
jgi:hypothetical protein